jgi:hypothetical protein
MSGIQDEAIQAGADAGWDRSNYSRAEISRMVLEAALPAIERAHLERLTAEAHAESERPAPAMERIVPSAAEGWLRARLDQTKEPQS